MQARRISLLFDSLLALTGAAAVFLSPIPRAYSVIVVLSAAAGAVWDLRARHTVPRHFLTAAGAAGFFLTLLPFQRETLAEQSLAALCILLSVKLLGKKARRDHLQVLALAAVVTLGAGSLAPELAFASLILIICTIGTLYLVWLPFSELWGKEGSGGLLGRLAATSLMMMVTALPLAVALFVILPRSVNPFWRGLGPAERRVSGFSDRIDLGAVGRLALSGDVAFRAEIVSPPGPLAAIPYWRGIVLEETDGRRWSALPAAVGVRLAAPGNSVSINYYVEPHGERQLFLLEQPQEARLAFRPQALTEGMVLRRRDPLLTRIRYLGISRPSALRQDQLSKEKRKRNLALPGDLSPKIRGLAGELADGAAGDEEIVERMLTFFSRGFTYTLDVPPPSGDPLEDFLIERRQGYCEHFASAMAIMLRAAGVPARLVAGYLGGEFNENGGYYIVSQSAAHTWVEAWIAGRGWRRLDPTPAASVLGGTYASRNAPPSKLWLDALRMKWNSWVVQYDAEVQVSLLRKSIFGLTRLRLPRLSEWDLPGLIPWLLLPLLVWILVRKAGRRPSGPLDERYRRFQTLAARRDIVRHSWEGPLDFGKRVAGAHPRWGHEAAEFASLWAALAYGGEPAGKEDLDRLDGILQALKASRP